MKNLWNIMRADHVMLSGGKKTIKILYFLLFIISIVFELILSPLAGFYFSMCSGMGLVSLLYGNEVRFHGEKLNAILPISRKELVTARFIRVFGLNSIACLANYLVLLLSMKLKLYETLLGMDLMNIMDSSIISNSTSSFGVVNILYWTGTAFSIICCSGAFSSFFRNSKSVSTELTASKNQKKGIIRVLVLLAVIFVVWLAIIKEWIPVSCLQFLLQIISMLINAADGWLWCAVALMYAGIRAAYCYARTILEYEDKEL